MSDRCSQLWIFIGVLGLGLSIGTLNAAELSVEEIIKRTRAASENESSPLTHTFLRHVEVTELKSGGAVKSKQSKLYRAYTDGREQMLLKVDGREPTPEEIADESKRHRKRKRKYLNDPARGEKPSSSKATLMGRNVELFHDKFSPELLGEELVGSRMAYLIRLNPNRKHRVESRTMDRVLNQLDLRVWIDREEFQVAKLEAALQDDITFLGGIAGALKGMKISVRQSRIGLNQWVDQAVSAFFDARVLWNSYHFQMESKSDDFQTLP